MTKEDKLRLRAMKLRKEMGNIPDPKEQEIISHVYNEGNKKMDKIRKNVDFLGEFASRTELMKIYSRLDRRR